MTRLVVDPKRTKPLGEGLRGIAQAHSAMRRSPEEEARWQEQIKTYRAMKRKEKPQ